MVIDASALLAILLGEPEAEDWETYIAGLAGGGPIRPCHLAEEIRYKAGRELEIRFQVLAGEKPPVSLALGGTKYTKP